jgi:hypothetical protein
MRADARRTAAGKRTGIQVSFGRAAFNVIAARNSREPPVFAPPLAHPSHVNDGVLYAQAV